MGLIRRYIENPRIYRESVVNSKIYRKSVTNSKINLDSKNPSWIQKSIGNPSWVPKNSVNPIIQESIVNLEIHRQSRNPSLWKGWNPYTPSRTRISNGMGHNRSKVSVTLAPSGFFHITLCNLDCCICQKFMRVARCRDRTLMKNLKIIPAKQHKYVAQHILPRFKTAQELSILTFCGKL